MKTKPEPETCGCTPKTDGTQLEKWRRPGMPVVWSFGGTQISSNGALLVMRQLDDALGLSGLASVTLCDTHRGKNTVHRLDGLSRQSMFGRLAGDEDVNDADRLALDPVMCLLNLLG